MLLGGAYRFARFFQKTCGTKKNKQMSKTKTTDGLHLPSIKTGKCGSNRRWVLPKDTCN